jgi:hypothetical protein
MGGDWLRLSEYCLEEVVRNISKVPGAAQGWTEKIRPTLNLVPSEFVLDRPIIFSKTKDRPVVFFRNRSNADYLVTSD